MPKKVIPRAQLEHIWNNRWRARTDLLWLCNNILDYKLVDPIIHGPMIAHLQQFPKVTREQAIEMDKILPNGTFQYTPPDPYTHLIGSRRRCLFWPRGWFKSTVNTIAHTVQWLLYFPQIAIADLFSTDGKAQDILTNGIKHHFQFNQKLRELFPEYCPKRKPGDWGNSEAFTLENRDEVRSRLGLPPRVEPSVMAQSLDKGQAGYHFDIIKCSDIVEEKNVETPSQMEKTKKRFGLLPKMLVKRPDGLDGWMDLEGTFYHPADLHADMIKQWLAEPEGDHTWQIFINGVFERDTLGFPRKYDPSELALPLLLDVNGRRVSCWPSAEPVEKLEKEEKDPREGGYVFACQKALDFKADKSGGRPFDGSLTWITREDYQKVPIAFHLITVDLANTDGPKSNPSVITTAGYDRAGRCYVCDIQRGKWGPEETIRRLFVTWKKFDTIAIVRKVVLEDTAYEHGLKPSIDRYSHTTGMYPPLHFAPADRTNSKVKKIINALQQPFKTGAPDPKNLEKLTQPDLRFVDPLDPEDEKNNQLVRTALELEFAECTVWATGTSDDILDTLSNQFIFRDWLGKENLGGAHTLTPQATERLREQAYESARLRMLNIIEPLNLTGEDEEVYDHVRRATGW